MIETIPYAMRTSNKTLAVFDYETDPFLEGRVPKPFTCGFYDGDTYRDFWGDDCTEQFFDWLSQQNTDYCIYAHNGGNFDFHFMLDYMTGERPEIRDGRLARIELCGQEFRDSWMIIPVPLGAYKKDDIDYNKLERLPVAGCLGREVHKAEIRAYQRSDCLYLYELVSGFRQTFGDRQTMAGAAINMLRSHHGFETMSEKIDAELRPFFFGGRNQCFETGVLHPSPGEQWNIYDRNSMYPTAMRDHQHPISGVPIFGRRFTPKTCFALIEARNEGALCHRGKNGSLDFTVERGTFFASIHEIRAGLDTGTLKIDRVIKTVDFREQTNFAEFVERFYSLRMDAMKNGDDVLTMLFKLILNGSYGKFALDSRRFEDNYMGINGKRPKGPMYHKDDEPDGWRIKVTRSDCVFFVRPNARRFRSFLNVATAASITGAARADLLRALQGAQRPIYCDTDSIICERLDGVTFDKRELGAWKTEATGDVACIGGKKLYAIFNQADAVKKASKGVKLTPEQIRSVCEGNVIEYRNPVPKFQLDGTHEWTTRNVRQTGVAA